MDFFSAMYVRTELFLFYFFLIWAGISGGAIAGISVAAIIGATFLALCFYFLIYRERKKMSKLPFLPTETYDQNQEHMHG